MSRRSGGREWARQKGCSCRIKHSLVPLDVHLIQRRAESAGQLEDVTLSPEMHEQEPRGLIQQVAVQRVVTVIPLARSARRTGLTSLAIRTKSPVAAAVLPPVAWMLMAVATPIAGGTSTLSSVTAPARGTLI